VSIASYRHLEGRVELPAGFTARQVTVRVYDRIGGRQFGLRVLYAR
jgi:hypothetical protein